jgi:hypothetical protein
MRGFIIESLYRIYQKVESNRGPSANMRAYNVLYGSRSSLPAAQQLSLAVSFMPFL